MKNSISVNNISKKFLLPLEKKDSFREFLFTAFRPQKYEVLEVLKNVSFFVSKGEFFGVVGKNGSGKSTLLKILSKIYNPDFGSVEVSGRVAPFLELGVGFNGELSAFENLLINGAVLGLSRKEILRRIDSIVDFSELSGFMNVKLKNFSSGMQVRLAFSIAMQSDADVFLLDEVLAVGDSSFQTKCFSKFRELKNIGKTIVFVSHDLDSMRKFADRVLYLRDAEVSMMGDTSLVLNKYVSDNAEMFSDNSVKTPTNAVVLKNIALDFDEKLKLSEKNSLKIKLVVSSKITYKNPTLGFILYNSEGVKVFYSNSKISGQTVPDLKTGDNEYFIELQNLNLSTGKYFLTLALSDENCFKDFMWRDKACSFFVENDSKGLGVCNFEHKFL